MGVEGKCKGKGKGKGKIRPTTGHEVADGMSRQCHAPAALSPGKTRYPLCRRLGGPRPVWTGAENLAPTGIRSPDHLASSESLYQLSYPGPLYLLKEKVL